jgi:hypothetical protein
MFDVDQAPNIEHKPLFSSVKSLWLSKRVQKPLATGIKFGVESFKSVVEEAVYWRILPTAGFQQLM